MKGSLSSVISGQWEGDNEGLSEFSHIRMMGGWL